ncbi:hypothetical protein ACWATR_37150 [Nostoc sp. UIC 10890]
MGKKMGRPIIPEEDKLTEAFYFRLRASEAQMIRELAEKEGKPPTEVIREYFFAGLQASIR